MLSLTQIQTGELNLMLFPQALLPTKKWVISQEPLRTIVSGNASVHHHHLSLNHEGQWGTTYDFATCFLHFPCSPQPSGTWRTPGLSIPRCCLPTSSSVYLVFLSLSLCVQDSFGKRPRNLYCLCFSWDQKKKSELLCWIFILYIH